jgi:hypothetical protein
MTIDFHWIIFWRDEMQTSMRKSWLQLFFGLAACSWMPHWSCHYYRLETSSSFVVGNWEFTRLDSAASLLIYTILIGINLVAISSLRWRRSAALLSGLLHLAIGSLHLFRLWSPFRFEVFGYAWPQGASLREAVIVIPFGILCLWIARQT